MTTNKPGNVNQQPLYSCTNCYEDYTWTAGDLRVYDGECWCDLCWDKRGWEFSDQLFWNDLEPYTPALQAECGLLRAAIRRLCNIYVVDDYYEGHMREESLDAAVNRAINAATREPSHNNQKTEV